VVLLNRVNLVQKDGKQFDVDALSRAIGCPVVCDNESGLDKVQAFCANANPYHTELTKPQISAEQSIPIIEKNYRWADAAIAIAQKKKDSSKETKPFDLDQVFLHPFWGPICFIGIMGVFFYSIFSLAVPLMDGIDSLFSWAGLLLRNILPAHMLTQLLVEGIIPGFAAIMVFVPQIAILFLGIGLMEGSGYLARGATIVDKPLSLIGLNGRSFVPLLSGYACAIPALMAARNIPGRSQRLMCQLIIPLMQCSARLPVYGLLLAILFAKSPLMSGLGLTAIYVSSMILSAVISAIGSRFIKPQDGSDFYQMELPRWKIPHIKSTLQTMARQTKSFVTKAGPIILTVSLCLWVLSVFPSREHSLMMGIGHYIEPVFRPMGVDWRVGVALLLAFAAREVFVSSLAVVFAIQSESTAGILSTIQNAVFEGSTQPIFTTSTVIGLIVFFMIAMQCMSTLAVMKKEMGAWKWPVVVTVGYIGLAYGLSVTMVQGLRLLGVS